MAAVYRLLGDPVAHSLSPLFQNAALRAAGVDAIYEARRVVASELPAEIARLRAREGGVAGANVTIPHKRAVMPLVDVLTDEAREVGAVNWLGVAPDGAVTGDNTDARGLAAALADAGVPLERRDATVLGTGGAARAAIVALLRGGARVWVCGRNEAARAELASDFGNRVQAIEAMNRAPKRCRDATVVVSAVPPDAWGAVAPAVTRPDVWIVDLAYAPGGTPAEKWARTRRLKSLGGLPMLLHQGALSFEQWTGRAFPMEAARAAVGLGTSG